MKKQTLNNNKPYCPHCNYTNIAEIGAGERTASIAVVGIFSKKTNKSFRCKNCEHIR